MIFNFLEISKLVYYLYSVYVSGSPVDLIARGGILKMVVPFDWVRLVGGDQLPDSSLEAGKHPLTEKVQYEYEVKENSSLESLCRS